MSGGICGQQEQEWIDHYTDLTFQKYKELAGAGPLGEYATSDLRDLIHGKLYEFLQPICDMGANPTSSEVRKWMETFPVIYKCPIFDFNHTPISVSNDMVSGDDVMLDAAKKIVAFGDPNNFPCRDKDTFYVDLSLQNNTLSLGNPYYPNCVSEFEKTVTEPIDNQCPTTRMFYDAYVPEWVTLDVSQYQESCESKIEGPPDDPDYYPTSSGSCPYVRLDKNQNYYRVSEESREWCMKDDLYYSGNDGSNPDSVHGYTYEPNEIRSCPEYRCDPDDPSKPAKKCTNDELAICRSDPTYIRGHDDEEDIACSNDYRYDTDDDDDDDTGDDDDETGEDKHSNDVVTVLVIAGVTAAILGVGYYYFRNLATKDKSKNITSEETKKMYPLLIAQ